ncbi:MULTISPECIES: branched-chain amino acid aminotransferase [unclassified Leucobacter]|uniref:branched-chain amino acid aminotransferase n=1 Tax=unclassified Leucobacter TaxID=2621730 RepID=UPI00165D45A5|nr:MULTISPECIES: branched-chain amino acid aminotransferase [unclassified Leucobacter]MBC9936891.1 branched-chain amino acid aminotransferase [Leucobacter sp. cx-87]
MTNTIEFRRTSATPLPAAEREAILANPGFGNHFTDHMVSIVWTKEGGWEQPELLPYGPIQLDPAASVLHYGQEIFEGLKAYRRADGSVSAFRVEANAARLNASARRLALPELPVELFVSAIDELVSTDADWVAEGAEASLYLRPFMIADESFLGVRAAHRARFMVIASPAGPYFAQGVKPVSIWLAKGSSRAGHGGTGEAKCGGNYASSLLPQEEAAANGCAQVLFLDSSTEDTIEELGGMNLFLVKNGDSLVTPALNGNILHGITRDSLIQLAKDRGLAVEERAVTVSEWQAGVADGTITEAFACGTAAVITPIGRLLGADGLDVNFGENAPGPLTMSLRDELTGIQTGRVADPHSWVREIVPAKAAVS